MTKAIFFVTMQMKAAAANDTVKMNENCFARVTIAQRASESSRFHSHPPLRAVG